MDYKSLLNLADQNQSERDKHLKNKQNGSSAKGPDRAAILAFKERMARKEEEKLRQEQRKKDQLLALRSQNSKSSRKQVAMATRTKDNNFAKIKVTSSEIEEQEAVNRKLTKQGILDKNERMKAKMELDKKLVGLSKKDREKAIAKFEREQAVSVKPPITQSKKTIKDIILESKNQPIKKTTTTAPPLNYDQILNMAAMNTNNKRSLEQEIHEKFRESLPKPSPIVELEKRKQERSSESTKAKINPTSTPSSSQSNGQSKEISKDIPRQPIQTSSNSTSLNHLTGVGNSRSTVGNGLRNDISRQPSSSSLQNSRNSLVKRPSANDVPRPKLPPIYSPLKSDKEVSRAPLNNVRPPVSESTNKKVLQTKGHSIASSSNDFNSRKRPLSEMGPPPSRRLEASPYDVKKRLPPPLPQQKRRPLSIYDDPYRPRKNLPPIYSNRPMSYQDDDEYDDEDDYDEEMDDFIDDGPINGGLDSSISNEIAKIFNYNKRNYIDDDDDIEEASFSQCMKEEKHSAKVGLMEDLEDIQREEQEKKAKLAKKKHRLR